MLPGEHEWRVREGLVQRIVGTENAARSTLTHAGNFFPERGVGLTILRVEEWWTKAIESFPELRAELNDTNEIFSPYALWFELLPLAEEAHRAADDHLLRRIYGYASWSYEQGDDLANAVAVSFYEHLLDEPWMRPLALPWLNARVVRDVRTLWSDRLSAEEMREVELLIASGESERHA